MRLVYITVSMPFGSGEAFFIPEANELRRRGHELLIVPRSPEGWEVVNRDAKELPALALRRPVVSLDILGGAVLELFARPAASLRVLAMLFRSRNLWMLAKNLTVFSKGLWLARRAKQWKADHIHAQWGLTTATIAMIASRLSGIPWSFTAHRGDIVDNNLLAVKTADAAFVRFISESGLKMAESLCGGLSRAKKVVVLHLGVEIPRTPPFSETAAESRTILCPANLLPVKGHQYLFHAIAALKRCGVECRLDVVGEGRLRGRLEALAKELSIDDRVRFLGQVPHERLLAMLQERRADLVVLPSVDLGEGLHEGIPVALIEPMSLGVPVISTSTGGIPELLRDGAGIMVPPKDPCALADAIERLLNDPALRKRLSEAGRRRVEEEFSVEAVVDRLTEYIRNAEQ